MKSCKKCILTEDIPGISFDQNGVCNKCSDKTEFIPIGEEILIKELEKAKGKKRTYDALVPLSGGKDSTYILYLAKKVYNLNVLTYTFDNGFFSELALENIEASVKKMNVDHIFYRPNWNKLKELYRSSLMNSGEICSVCGIGIEKSMLKISADWNTPLILLGHSPLENDSFSTEEIYDPERLKAVLADNKPVSKKMIDEFLIYPEMGYLKTYLYTKLGKFGKKINPQEKQESSIYHQENARFNQ